MKLCITEKPSVARDIASLLGANNRHDGYLEGNGYTVTWTYGHLCTLKEPADYTPNWRVWSLGQLPMLPPKFGIKVIPQQHIERQFKVIESLLPLADVVINCGDAGQEGELIQRWVMQKAGVNCPVERLWISSLTDESIKEGFKSLRPQSEYDTLYHAGLSRAVGDWILGINATRLYSLKYGSGRGSVLSVGRVQTPTLALIVERQREIENFKPQDFWEIRTLYRGAVFNSRAGRFDSEADAQAVIDRVAAEPLTITSVEQRQGREAPPKLFDLTSLQVECNKRWGWSADETLSLIQSLYEKKVTTYPRVDTVYLTTDLRPKIPDIMRRMTPYAPQTAPVLERPITQSKRVFDNSKVTDHHAIIPTGESPSVLAGNERNLYHLIALRFIAAFWPDCEYMQTTVNARAADVEFRATGKVITAEGWRSVLTPAKDDAADAADADSALLPPFTEGESGAHEPQMVKKTTQPPKYYTEGTLLRAMESAGKSVDDEELREALKENGIGRPSTRSAIIETLFKRRYIARQRKNIIATEAGKQLIDTIDEPLLKSAKLTGIWENKLRRIERGDYSAADFIAELKAQIGEIVTNVLSDNSSRRIIVNQSEEPPKKAQTAKTAKPAAARAPRAPRVTDISQIACPGCGEGHLVKGRTAYGCSRYAEGCHTLLPFETYSPDLSPAKLNSLIKKTFKINQKK